MNTKRKRKFLFTSLFALVILILSIFPVDISNGPTPFYFQGMDKLVHASMYFVFTILVLSEFFFKQKIRKLPFFLIITIIFFYSIMVELIQHFVILSRSGEIYDALANLAGILFGSFLVVLFKMIKS